MILLLLPRVPRYLKWLAFRVAIASCDRSARIAEKRAKMWERHGDHDEVDLHRARAKAYLRKADHWRHNAARTKSAFDR